MSGIQGIRNQSAASPIDSSASAKKTLEAAQQFEALLIASMLQSCRQNSSLSSGEDAGGDSAIGYAEEHLAQALASKGGLGIAQMVVSGLEDQNRLYAAAKGAGEDPRTTTGASSGESL